VYRSYFVQMKENFRDRGNEIAASHFTHAADLADVPDLLHVRIMEGNRVVDEWAQPAEVQERAHEAPITLVALPGTSPGGEPRSLELTFGISREIYANFLALREAMEKEHDLDRVLPVILPQIFRGSATRCSSCWRWRSSSGRGSRALGDGPGRNAARRRQPRRRGRPRRPRRGARQGRARRAGTGVQPHGRRARRRASRLGYLQKVSAWQEVARGSRTRSRTRSRRSSSPSRSSASKYRGGEPEYQRLWRRCRRS
jgi:hypothetical protein